MLSRRSRAGGVRFGAGQRSDARVGVDTTSVGITKHIHTTLLRLDSIYFDNAVRAWLKTLYMASVSVCFDSLHLHH